LHAGQNLKTIQSLNFNDVEVFSDTTTEKVDDIDSISQLY